MSTIKKVKLSKIGPEVSRIVAGAWRWESLGKKEISNLVDKCLSLGISTFDHADIYGNYSCEALFGEALGKGQREKMQLVSKCGIRLMGEKNPNASIKTYDTTKNYIVGQVENSLKNLKTDRLDLLLIHRPDPLMAYDEIAEAFMSLHQSGKVLHFGVSNFAIRQFEALNSRFPLVTNQVEASVLQLLPFVDGTTDMAQKLNFRPMAWSPFAGGNIFTVGEKERQKAVVSVLNQLAVRHQVSVSAIALMWLLMHPAGFVPILGTTKVERLDFVTQLQKFQLSREEWYLLWTAATGSELP